MCPNSSDRGAHVIQRTWPGKLVNQAVFRTNGNKTALCQ